MRATLLAKLKTSATSASNRVYGDVAPQGATAPYIVFQLISTVDENTHNGYADLMRSRWQVACYATGATAAQTLADEVVDGLRDWVSSPVQACFRDGSVSGYESGAGVYGQGLFHVIVDWLIWHTDETDGEGE